MRKNTIFHYQKSGLWTTVQDSGRQGHQAFGIPISGVMDENSASIANQLVGNSTENPVLEITLFGPIVQLEGEAIISITGADLSAKINDKDVPIYESVHLKNGDILAFGKPKNGCRAYLAIAGNWQVKKWLGSASSATQNAEILTPDSVFQKGSQLQIVANLDFQKKVYPKELRPKFSDLVRIRVRKGPEYDWFPEKIRQQFFGKIHQVSQNFNRMGIQLEKKLKGFVPKQELISSGIVPGVIQITNAGQPIILLQDAQTTGGYWRIGNVVLEDLSKLAQVKTGDKIWISLA